MLDDFLKPVVIDAEHHRTIHLDEAAIGVPGEAGIVRSFRKALDGDVVQAEVQHGVHHAGHRNARAGADGHQQWMVRLVAEIRGRQLSRQRPAPRRPAAFSSIGVIVVVVIVGRADVRGDGEARRDRQADRGHLGQIGSLPAQQVAHIRSAFVVTGAKAVNPLGHVRTPSSLRYGRSRRSDP